MTSDDPTSHGPTGTLTLLFTDIEGSTRLLQQLGSTDYSKLLAVHHGIMRAALTAGGGTEVKTEGDSFFATFARATDAVETVVRMQRDLAAHDWPAGEKVFVRMGMHTGEIGLVANEYVGLDIHRAARIAAAAHGGQVVVSATTRELVGDRLPAGVTVVDLGEHRLKDLQQPEHLYQLVVSGLRTEFPPLRSLATRFELLPAEVTPFVGRERELETLAGLLEATRLLTLTGPGGTGKTRMAQRLARNVSDDFADGVAFVALAPISDSMLVATTVRQALVLPEEPGRSSIETVTARLAGKRVLLVLDNFEQVLPAASFVQSLLEATSATKVVVTSRSVLHLEGEQEFPVPPLAVPQPSDTTDIERLSQSEAVALFMQRAKSVAPSFVLNASNAAAIVEICARLDGLPLAIELAASRIKVLPPQALLSRLSRSLDFLQSASEGRPDRQRTLRGAINWSYELLDPEQRAVFRWLGVFVGGFRLDDAEALLVAGGLSTDALDGISTLIDQSLVRQVDAEGEPRFTMLETIREFAVEQLTASSELERAAGDHANRFAELASQAEPALTGGPLWLNRLEADQANLRSGLTWLADHAIERALTMGGSLWRFWQRRGHLREGAALLTALLDRPAAQSPTLARAHALIGLAGIVYWQLNYEAAERAYEEALTIARALADERLEAEVQYSLAYIEAVRGEWAGAHHRMEMARDVYRRLGDEMGVASTVMFEGMLATLTGDNERALEVMDAAIALFRRAGNTFGLANTLGMKSRVLIEIGRNDEARIVNREYLQVGLEQHEPTALSGALMDTASLEALAGRADRAARLYGAGLRVADDAGGEAPPELVRRIELTPLLEAQLEPSTLASLIAEGRQMADDQAAAYALDVGAKSPMPPSLAGTGGSDLQ